MIFAPPRFIVLDDNKEHIDTVVQAFQRLGTACMGIHYDPAKELNAKDFSSVRTLFLDIHLIDAIPATEHTKNFAVLANILESTISEQGGPFLLVLWTEYPDLADKLKTYLYEKLDSQKPYTRPLAVVPFPKEKFLADNEGLRKAIIKAVKLVPQLAALLAWEMDTLIAAGDTLASLMSLIPVDKRNPAEFSGELDILLSRLASEAVGSGNVDNNQRAAISSALAPILADRIMNQEATAEIKEIWKMAVTKYRNNEQLQSKAAGQINKMLHLAMPPSESIKPADWGAVVKWPFEWTDDELMSRMGLKKNQILGGEFLIEGESREQCKPVLIRIGAPCDYAQNRKGPLIYLLGMEIPDSAIRKKDSSEKELKQSEAIWQSPVFVQPITLEPFRLYAHFRLPVNITRDVCANWEVRYRLREQLLTDLIISSSNYGSRPGIVQLSVRR